MHIQITNNKHNNNNDNNNNASEKRIEGKRREYSK